MADTEQSWDRRLQIKTCGRDETGADQYHHPYEPTPYRVLERLADSGLIGSGDRVLDYGCGKGRVSFFLAWRTRARTVGIEYDERICRGALENQKTALPKAKAEFMLARAEEYEVPPDITRCYFFNPFSLEILHKVMARILGSWYEHPRQILLFFYYPSDAFLSGLAALAEPEYFGEISCGDLFPGEDPRERIVIFRLPDYGAES